MEQPFGLHLLHTDVTAAQTLHYRIPSPLGIGNGFHIAADLFPTESANFVNVELWGNLVSAPGEPATTSRHLLGQGSVEMPKIDPNSHEFMQALINAVAHADFFHRALGHLISRSFSRQGGTPK